MSISFQQRQSVRTRAGLCCEYCRLPEAGDTIRFHIDHIIPLRFDGSDDESNLCLACYKCNGYKGYKIAAIDPFQTIQRAYSILANTFGMITSNCIRMVLSKA